MSWACVQLCTGHGACLRSWDSLSPSPSAPSPLPPPIYSLSPKKNKYIKRLQSSNPNTYLEIKNLKLLGQIKKKKKELQSNMLQNSSSLHQWYLYHFQLNRSPCQTSYQYILTLSENIRLSLQQNGKQCWSLMNTNGRQYTNSCHKQSQPTLLY